MSFVVLYDLIKRVSRYLLRDEFTTADPAPLASPMPAEPGPGIRTVVADTASVLSKAADDLVVGAATGTNDPLVSWGSINRISGRALFSTVEWDANGDYTRCGWSAANNTYPTHCFAQPNSLLAAYDAVVLGAISLTTTYPVAYVMRSSGGMFYFLKDTDWKLMWINESDTTDPLYVTGGGYSAGAQTFTVEYVRVRRMRSPFTLDYGISSVSEDTVDNNTPYTATADAIHDLTVTAPNPLSGTIELRYRVADSSNYWTAYFNDTGAFRLDSVSSGTPTNRISVAAVIAADDTRTIRVICEGSVHNCYTLDGTTWTKRGAEINVSHQNTQTTVKVVAS